MCGAKTANELLQPEIYHHDLLTLVQLAAQSYGRVCKLTCWLVVQFCRVQEVSNVKVTLCMNKFRLLENRGAVDLRAGDAENPPGVP